MDQVERAQQTVQPGKNAQAFLRPIEIPGVKRIGFEAEVDIALKRQDGLFGRAQLKLGLPARVPFRVEYGQLVADAHEVAQVLRSETFQVFDEFGGVVDEARLADAPGCGRGIEIQALGW